jgi:hypothetical protein
LDPANVIYKCFRKSIFIFLSNTGSRDIVDKCVELERRGVEREEYSYKDFERILKDESYLKEGTSTVLS